MFQSLLQPLFASLFGSMFAAKILDINFNLYINLAAAKLRGRHRRGRRGNRG